MEIWRPVAGDARYEVSNLGRVRSWAKRGRGQHLLPEPRILSLKKSARGYMEIKITRKTRYVHHLVLEAFVGPKPFDGAVTRHLNDDPTDNRIENIMWGTYGENNQDRWDRTGLRRSVSDAVQSD